MRLKARRRGEGPDKAAPEEEKFVRMEREIASHEAIILRMYRLFYVFLAVLAFVSGTWLLTESRQTFFIALVLIGGGGLCVSLAIGAGRRHSPTEERPCISNPVFLTLERGVFVMLAVLFLWLAGEGLVVARSSWTSLAYLALGVCLLYVVFRKNGLMGNGS